MEDIHKLLNINYNNVRPQKGKVLISQPLMMDGWFRRAVVLLTEYSEKGAIGYVLNKNITVSIEGLMDDFPTNEISIGGPVASNTLHYMHTFRNIPDAVEIVSGIYWGGNFETISQYLSMSVMKPEDIRFFIGYSGWSAKQLDEELENNSWLVSDIRPSKIIQPPRDLWLESVKSMGEPYQMWTTFPENPGLN